MSAERIEPSKITRPIQLLAAWLVGLVAIDSTFLGAAALIEKPEWAPGFLVVAAIVNVPIFIICLFLLQTKFRAEMQGDDYYLKYLEWIKDSERSHSKKLKESLIKLLGSNVEVEQAKVEDAIKDAENLEIDKKGIIFDTNKTYDNEAVWEMMENDRVSAYGDMSYVVEYLNPGDTVFYAHKGVGIISAAEVLGPVKSIDDLDEQYREVKFLTQKPSRHEGIKKYLTFAEVKRITGKEFFWARTIKVPYLKPEESNGLLDELKTRLSN